MLEKRIWFWKYVVMLNPLLCFPSYNQRKSLILAKFPNSTFLAQTKLSLCACLLMYTPQNLIFVSRLLLQYPDTDKNKDGDVSILVLHCKSSKQKFLLPRALIIVRYRFIDGHFISATWIISLSTNASGDTPSHGHLGLIINPTFPSLKLLKFNFVAYCSHTFFRSGYPNHKHHFCFFLSQKLFLRKIWAQCIPKIYKWTKLWCSYSFFTLHKPGTCVLWPRDFSSIFQSVSKSIHHFSINFLLPSSSIW